ncbi:putative ribonuclease H-like domain-containing protein [Tanacetum coccineum]
MQNMALLDKLTSVLLIWSNKAEDTSGDKYEQMEYDLKIRDLKLEEKQKELDQALKERDDFKDKLEKWSNASVLQNEVLNKQRYVFDKSCIGFGVESSSGIDSANSSRNTSESSYPNFQKATGFHSVPPPTDWVDSDDEETVLNSSEIQRKTVSNSENSETSFENRSPSSQNSVGQGSRKTGLGHKGGQSEEDLKRGGYVALEMILNGTRKNSGKGTSKTSLLDFEKFSYEEELKFNLLSVLSNLDKSTIGITLFGALGQQKDDEAVFMAQKIGAEIKKGKGPDWMFDLDLLTPSMNYIPVRKENYADSGGQETACNDVEDFDEQHFIVHGPNIHAAQHKPSEERTANKEVPLSSEEQALHDELVNLMHQESLAKLHNDAQRNAFEKEKKRNSMKGKRITTKIHRPAVCLFLSQEEPKKVSQALADESWVEAMQEELLQFKLQDVWVLCDLPDGKRGTDKRKVWIMMEVFAQLPRTEASGLLLAFASFMGFTVYQMDVKSAFLYGNITEEVYVKQPPGFEDPSHPNKVKRLSSTEAEYVAAASCCAQIRHHFIRDCYEQRLINVVKVHTDDNVADLLTKGFDLARFNFLVVTVGSLEALLQHLRGGYA